MRPQIVKILTLVLVIINSTTMLAQKAGPPVPGGDRRPPQPIDESVLVLIVIGLIYGVYIVYKKKQLKNNL